jgi:hypothetical protein
VKVRIAASAREDIRRILSFQWQSHRETARIDAVRIFFKELWPTLPDRPALAGHLRNRADVKKIFAKLGTVQYTIYFTSDEDDLVVLKVIAAGVNFPSSV